MLNFLGLSRYMEIRIIYVEEDDDIYVEIDGYVKNREHKDSDIEAILNNNISYQHRHAQIVAVYIDVPQRFYFPEKLMEDYKLDCMYITNYKNLVSDDHHAIAGITMNKHLYLYDGQRAVFQHSLKSYNWKKGRTGMSASSFVMSYDKRGVLRYDISKSSRVAFYVLDE